MQLSFLTELYFTKHISILPFLMILLMNAVFLVYSNFYYKKSNYVPISIKRLTNTYVFLLTLASVIITINDVVVYNQMMLFTLIVIVVSSNFIIEIRSFIVSLIINYSILLIGLSAQQGYTEQFQNQILYLMNLFPIAIYISLAFNRSYTNTLSAQKRLMEEIKEKRVLTSELSAANYRLSLQATLDPMTGLMNRKALNEYMVELASCADKEPIDVTVLMLDVDYFKSFNDTYGHLEGDQVLIRVAEVLYSMSQEYDFFAARYGGEEFTIVLTEASEQHVQSICEEIVERVDQLKIPHEKSEVANHVTVSIGGYGQIATNRTMILHMLEQADRALYTVKNNGRHGYELQTVAI